jgi:hypothetical protein
MGWENALSRVSEKEMENGLFLIEIEGLSSIKALDCKLMGSIPFISSDKKETIFISTIFVTATLWMSSNWKKTNKNSFYLRLSAASSIFDFLLAKKAPKKI